MVTFKKIMTGLVILVVMLTSSISFADGKSGKYKFKQLNPVLQKTIKKSLKKSNLPSAKELLEGGRWLTVEATTSCPSSCPTSGPGGMCYCDRKPDGSCPSGQTPTTLGGKEKCRVAPTKTEITGTDSSGNIIPPMEIQTGRPY